MTQQQQLDKGMPLDFKKQTKHVKETLIPGSEPKKKETKNEHSHVKEIVENMPPSDTPAKDEKEAREWLKANTTMPSPTKEYNLSHEELLEILKNPLGLLVEGNEKDADFIHSYMRLGNVKEALIDCEYAPLSVLKSKTALTTLSKEMMRRPEIQAAISWCKAQRLDDLIISREEFSDYLTQIARGDIANMLDDNGMLIPSQIKKHGRCIETFRSTISKSGQVSISLKMRDPIRAAQELAKYESWEEQQRGDNANTGSNLADEALEAINSDIIDVTVQEDDEKPETTDI